MSLAEAPDRSRRPGSLCDAKSEKLTLLNPRFAMSFLRGPMTGVEIRRAKEAAE